MVTHVRAITGYFWQQATLKDCFTFMVESQEWHTSRRAEEQSGASVATRADLDEVDDDPEVVGELVNDGLRDELRPLVGL